MTGAPPGNSTGYSPIDDEVFTALRSRRRRYVLYVLLVHESISTTELADAVAGWTGVASGMVSPGRREEVDTSLRHRDLPALEDADLLTREGDTVSRTDWPRRVRELIEMALEEETGSTA